MYVCACVSEWVEQNVIEQMLLWHYNKVIHKRTKDKSKEKKKKQEGSAFKRMHAKVLQWR